MTEEQSVVKQPDATATPNAEGASAQDMDLDSLLNEYKSPEETNETPKPKDEASKDPTLTLEEIQQDAKFLRSLREEEANQSAARQLDEVVKSVKGDLGVPDKFVKAYLNQEALERPELAKAYLDRKKSPEKWQKIEKQLQNELKQAIGSQPSKDATATANEVVSAVLNAQPQTPNQVPKNIYAMSDAEFEKQVQSMAKG